jgi:hypothetical protein
MNWIIPAIIYFIGYVVIITLFRKKMNELEREKFDLNWQYKDQTKQHNEFENALILIAKGDLLKREMVELAEKTLESPSTSVAERQEGSSER